MYLANLSFVGRLNTKFGLYAQLLAKAAQKTYRDLGRRNDMKTILAMCILSLFCAPVFANSATYFNVGESSKLKVYYCELHLENNWSFTGNAKTSYGPDWAFYDFVESQSIGPFEWGLIVEQNEDLTLSYFVEIRNLDKDIITETIRVLDESFCKLLL